MKILLTGGAGFIGSHLAEGFLAQGYEVVIVDNLSTGQESYLPPAATFYPLDIRSKDLLGVFEQEKPQVVCHHAAQMSVLVSLRDPQEDASHNILGSLNVLACAQKTGVKQFIFASSGGTVYGEPMQLPVREDAPLLPLSPYGISKMSFEHYLRVSGLPHTILRYANVYGPRQNPHGEAGVIAIFAQKMAQGETVTIYGEGNQSRDFIYVGDVVAANLAVLGHFGVFNIGTGIPTSVNTIFEQLSQIMGYTHLPVYSPAKKGEVYQITLDCQHAQHVLAWQPKVSLSEGLGLTV